MNKIEITKRHLIIIGFISVFAAIFTVFWMAFTGNAPQLYDDIIIGTISRVRSNKDAEILLLRFLIVIGSVAIYFMTKCKLSTPVSLISGKTLDASSYFIAWIVSVFFLKLFFFMQISQIFLFALCFAVITFLIEKEIIVSTLCLFFLGYYTCFAIYHFFNFLESYKIIKFFSIIDSFKDSMAIVFAILCTGISFFCKNRKSLQKKFILVLQLMLPALFLILSIKEYNYNGNIDIIGIPSQAKIFIIFAVILTFADALKMLKNSWKLENSEISNFISIGACISIMCFNFYGGQGVIVSDDMHHPYENIFAFQQIFELGQIPYKDFIPPSGLYSVLHGAFFKLFGNGNIAYMNLCDNIYFYTIIALSLFILQFHIKKIWCLAVALFLQFPRYNRVTFMTIIILLLLLPELVKRSNLWLKVFLLANVFHGLYYPVFGVACMIGFMPMFVIQVRKVISDDKKPFKTIKFWIEWACVFSILIASVPLLWGTLIHVKAMAGQSVLSDSISIFGQELPDWFMPYARNIIRYPIYNTMHVVPLALMVWLPFLFLCIILSICKQNGKITFNLFAHNIELFTIVISLILIPLVSYTFTFVRVDMLNFFSRSWSALICVLILYIVFVSKYVKSNLYSLLAILLLNILIVPSFGIGIDNSENKLFSKINVPDDYVLVDNFKYDTVGKCFLNNDFLANLNNYEQLHIQTSDKSTFSVFPWFGYYYIFKQKGGANIEPIVMKCFTAAKETRSCLNKNKIHVGNCLSPDIFYYIYNWLLASGEYVWDRTQNCFVPNYGNLDYSEVKKRNVEAPIFYDNYDLGNSANVFGLSFKTLKKNFTEKEIAYNIHKEEKKIIIDFSDYIYGNDMDFIYIEFADFQDEFEYTLFNGKGEYLEGQSNLISKFFLKKRLNPYMCICVSFYDENEKQHFIIMPFRNGKLLVNLGVGVKYLLENHNRLEINVYNGWDESGNLIPFDSPELKKIQFLKCRQIY